MKNKMTIKKTMMAAMMMLAMALTFVAVSGTAEAFERKLGKLPGNIRWRTTYDYTKKRGKGSFNAYVGKRCLTSFTKSNMCVDMKCDELSDVEKVGYRITTGKNRAKLVGKDAYDRSNKLTGGKVYELFFKKPGKVTLQMYIKYKNMDGIHLHTVKFDVSKLPTNKTLTMEDGSSQKFWVGAYQTRDDTRMCGFTKKGIVELVENDDSHKTGYYTIKALKPGTTYMKLVVKNEYTGKTMLTIKKKIVVKEPKTWKSGGKLDGVSDIVVEGFNPEPEYGTAASVRKYRLGADYTYYVTGTNAYIVSASTDKSNYKVKKINRRSVTIRVNPKKGDGFFTVSVKLSNGETVTKKITIFDTEEEYESAMWERD